MARAKKSSSAHGTDQSARLSIDTHESHRLLNPLEDALYDSMLADVLALQNDMANDKVLPPIEPVSTKQMLAAILHQGSNVQNTHQDPEQLIDLSKLLSKGNNQL